MWLDLALDASVDCVIVEGMGGSGKTFFSMLAAMELMKQLGESQEALRIINESVETINSADRRNTLTHVETMAVCGVSASFCVACAAYQLMLLFNMYDPQNGYQLLPY